MGHHDQILFLRSVQHLSSLFLKHMTLGAFATLEGRRSHMSTIRIKKKYFLTLKFACCATNFKLCPLVGEKLLL